MLSMLSMYNQVYTRDHAPGFRYLRACALYLKMMIMRDAGTLLKTRKPQIIIKLLSEKQYSQFVHTSDDRYPPIRKENNDEPLTYNQEPLS